MTSASQRQDDDTIVITINIPWADVEKLYNDIVEKQKSEMELPGFRKGKAPSQMVEEKLDKTKVYEEVLKDLLPKVYNEAITEQKLRPIISPKIELKEASEKKDWIIIARTCERPTLTLGDYKTAIQDLKTTKQKKLWVPGQEVKQNEQGKQDQQNKQNKPTLDEILKAVYEVVKTNLPILLIEHEVNRLLSDLIDQTKKLGLSVDQYLASTSRTANSVRHEYEDQAKRSLALEFALEDIADKEGVLVSDDDIDNIIKTAKTDQEKEALSKERYYLASVLRRQKTLDFLAGL